MGFFLCSPASRPPAATRAGIRASFAIGFMIAFFPANAQAEESRRYAALYAIYYDYAVADYCRSIDRAVHDGFVLLRKFLLARDKIGKTDDHSERIAAFVDADLEYANRGLSGQKLWCRTEGDAAVRRFTLFFQKREIE
jgi:hypothetical protein